MNSQQELLHKKYFEDLPLDYFLDFKINQKQWRVARLIQKDKKSMVVLYDTYSTLKEEQIYLGSAKIAPFRMHTQGYTGSSLKKGLANNKQSIFDLKKHIAKFVKVYHNEQEIELSPLEITQFLRGELFFCICDILTIQEELSTAENQELLSTFSYLIEVICKFSKKVSGWFENQYMQKVTANNAKYLYLQSAKVSVLQSLSELYWSLVYILRIECPKFISLFKKNGRIKEEVFHNVLYKAGNISPLYNIFKMHSDGGKYVGWAIRKVLFRLLYKYFIINALHNLTPNTNKFSQLYPHSEITVLLQEIDYPITHHSEIFTTYSFQLKYLANLQENASISEVYVWNLGKYIDLKLAAIDLYLQKTEICYFKLMLQMLINKEVSMDAKLKCLQELKKCLGAEFNQQGLMEDEHRSSLKFKFIKAQKVGELIARYNVVEVMLNEYSFNPEIFKRFIPILEAFAKQKLFSPSKINQLFHLLKTRHESEVGTIFEILTNLASFLDSDSLDTIFQYFGSKVSINGEESIKFLRNFTIKAIQNLKREKGFLGMMMFRKVKSSNYGFYGLELLYKESLDTGGIECEYIGSALMCIRSILENEHFEAEKVKYLGLCLDELQKCANFPQSIKLFTHILITYPTETIFAENRKSVLEKIDSKRQILQLMITSIKKYRKSNHKNQKIPFAEGMKFFYEFLQNFGDYLRYPLTIEHIEYLWSQEEIKLLIQFLQKTKEIKTEGPYSTYYSPPNEVQNNQAIKKYQKRISFELIESILLKIVTKKTFYQRKLTPEEFQFIEDIFIIYHESKKNLQISDRGFIRYLQAPNLKSKEKEASKEQRNCLKLEGEMFYFNFLVHFKSNAGLFEKIYRKMLSIYLNPKSLENIEMKINTWREVLVRSIETFKSDEGLCLKCIRIMMEMIEGRMTKETVNRNVNVEIIIQFNVSEKILLLPKNMTIFALRKHISREFPKLAENSNFIMYSVELNREITFVEEEDFSLSALPTPKQNRAPTIKIYQKTQKRQDKHLHQQALEQFARLIEKEDNIYQSIFSLQIENQPKLITQFWQIMDTLPLNHLILQRIEECDGYKKKSWENLIKNSFSAKKSSAEKNKSGLVLEYILNILEKQLAKSNKYVEKFHENEGFFWIEDVMKDIFLKEQTDVQQKIQHIRKIQTDKLEVQADQRLIKLSEENIINKLLLIFAKKESIKPFDSKDTQNMEDSPLKRHGSHPMYQILLEMLNRMFGHLYPEVLSSHAQGLNLNLEIGIDLINNVFKIMYRYCSKQIKKIQLNKIQEDLIEQFQPEMLSVDIVLNILEYIIFFEGKSQSLGNKFSTSDPNSFFLLNYILTFHIQMDEKLKILHRMMSYLELNPSKESKVCLEMLSGVKLQFFFTFLIDYLNSFIVEEERIIYNDGTVYRCIEAFIFRIVRGDFQCEPSHQEDLIFHAIRLLIFTVNSQYFHYDYIQIGQALINHLLFSYDQHHTAFKIKKQKTAKILYDIIKKICFLKKEVVVIIAEKCQSLLQGSSWRKNNIYSWSLEPEKNEKNLYVGLQNLGATCYINSLFQQLYSIKQFSQKLLELPAEGSHTEIHRLQEIFSNLSYSTKRSISTKSFCDAFITYEGMPINPMVQSDVDQFFNMLIQKIGQFLKFHHQESILSSLFEGTLSNIISSEGCAHTSEKMENFMSIGINIRGKKTLQDSLETFVEPEILDGSNAYYCEICQKKVRATKRLCIKKLPKVLVLVLKRFQFDYDTMKKIKINSLCKFEEQLNLDKYTVDHIFKEQQNENLKEQNSEYTLRGTIIHSGTSEAGHYYSFIKQKEKWFKFNDEIIEEVDYSKVEEEAYGGGGDDSAAMLEKEAFQFRSYQKYKNAYILIYQRNQPSEQPRLINLNPVLQENTGMQEEKRLESQNKMQLQKSVVRQNVELAYLSTFLNPNFILLFENISLMQLPCSPLIEGAQVSIENMEMEDKINKFVLLYFHSVLLRDKRKDEYFLKFYRIARMILANLQTSHWYIRQINHQFIKQFCIESPKLIRYIVVSLIQIALQNIKEVPINFINHAFSCVKRNGMTPFFKIFKDISAKPEGFVHLFSIQFPKRVLELLLINADQVKQKGEKKEEISVVKVEEFESYFGQYTLQNEKERQLFSSQNMILALKPFELGLHLESIINLNEKVNSLTGNRILASMLVEKTKELSLEDLEGILKLFEAKIFVMADIKDTHESGLDKSFKKEWLQKYLLYIRYLIAEFDKKGMQAEQDEAVLKVKSKKMQMLVEKVKQLIREAIFYLDPIELALKQIIKIMKISKDVQSICREVFSVDFYNKYLKGWLKQIEKPLIMEKIDEFRRKLMCLGEDEKRAAIRENKQEKDSMVDWLIGRAARMNEEEIGSDIEDQKYEGLVGIGDKKFRVLEHIGCIKRVQIHNLSNFKDEKYGVLEKFEFDILM